MVRINFKIGALFLGFFFLALTFSLFSPKETMAAASCGPASCGCVNIFTGNVMCQVTSYSNQEAVVCKCGLTANCYKRRCPTNRFCQGDNILAAFCTSATETQLNCDYRVIDSCDSGWLRYYQCRGSYLQRLWIEQSCLRGSCTRGMLSYENYDYCGSGSCESWDDPYCYRDDVYRERTCYSSCRTWGWDGRGYTGGSCGSYSYTDRNKLYECGNNGWLNNYQCSGDMVQREYAERGCESASCYEDTYFRDYEDCSQSGQVCQDGQCVVTSSTLYIDIEAIPSSGEVPLNDVDLKATVSGTAEGTINYKFDCQNDGVWEREISSDSVSYTAEDLCNYSSPNNYTAKVRVERGSADPVEETISIEVSPKPNHSPNANFSCSVAGCYAYSGSSDPSLKLLNSSTDPDGQDDIVESEWKILNYSGGSLDCSDRCDYPVQSPSLPDNEYDIRLTVTDEAGETDSITKTINIREDIEADFLCSLSGQDGDWHNCDEFKGIQEEYTYFKDNSTLSETSNNFVERVWELGGEVFESDTGINPVPTAAVIIPERSSTVKLTVTDNKGRTDTVSYSFEGKLPLPTWEEIGS